MPALPSAAVVPAAVALLLVTTVSIALLPASAQVPVAVLQGTGVADPDPVVPGTTGSIDLTLRNVGNTTTFQMDAYLIEVDEAIIVRGDTPSRLGGLGPGGSTTASPFTFEVPVTTSPGAYPVRIEIIYTYNQGGVPRTSSMSISVAVTVQAQPTLFIEGFRPGELRPGTQETATITLANRGSATFTNILGTWTSEGGVLLPLGGSNSFHVQALGPGNTTAIPVDVSARQDALPGLYALTFALAYRDAGGSAFSTTSTVGIRIEGQPGPQVQVSIQDIDSRTVTLAATNVGTAPVTGVQLHFTPPPGQRVLGRDTAALGNLAPGEFLTAKFDIDGRPLEDSAASQVQVTYTDSGGTRRAELQPLKALTSIGLDGDLLVTLQDLDSDLLVLAVTNTGVTPVTGVRVRLVSSPDLTVSKADTLALGNLAPGEFKEAEFEVDLAHGTDAPLSATVEVLYTDEEGDRRSLTQDVHREGVPAPPPRTATETATLALVIITLIAAGIAGMWGYRRHRRNKQLAAAKAADEAWSRLHEASEAEDAASREDGWERRQRE